MAAEISMVPTLEMSFLSPCQLFFTRLAVMHLLPTGLIFENMGVCSSYPTVCTFLVYNTRFQNVFYSTDSDIYSAFYFVEVMKSTRRCGNEFHVYKLEAGQNCSDASS